MASDLAAWCRSCQQCQRAKVTKQPAAAIQPIPIPQRRFSHVHMDLVGPLPVSGDGFLYIFTIIDRTTRWLEAVPLKEMSAATCSQVFFSHWVSRFGVPATVMSDRGTQLCKHLGIELDCYILSSSGQWDGRMCSQTAEGRLTCSGGRRGLA